MVAFGFGAGFEDLFRCMILYCGKSRIDYCFFLLYIYSVIGMCCTIMISLLFFWQISVNTDSDPVETDEIMIDSDGDKLVDVNAPVYDFSEI